MTTPATSRGTRGIPRVSPLPGLARARPPAWAERALCAQADPDLWFPDRGDSARPAQKVCARCPVRVPCLAYALAIGEPNGIWGGLTSRQRCAPLTRRGNAA